MDTEHAIHTRLAMILDDKPNARILVIGQHMPAVRAAYREIERAVSHTMLRQVVCEGGYIRAVTNEGGTLEAYALYSMASGRSVDAVLFVGELTASAELTIESLSAAGAIVFTSLGV